MKIENVLKEVVRRCGLKMIAYSKAETFTLSVFLPLQDKPGTQFQKTMTHGWVGYKDIKGEPSQSPPLLITGKQFPEKADDLIEILCNHFGAEDRVLKGAFNE